MAAVYLRTTTRYSTELYCVWQLSACIVCRLEGRNAKEEAGSHQNDWKRSVGRYDAYLEQLKANIWYGSASLNGVLLFISSGE